MVLLCAEFQLSICGDRMAKCAEGLMFQSSDLTDVDLSLAMEDLR